MGNIEHDGEQLMREQPTGEMLLQAARDALKDKVLPLLQGDAAADAKREVLMVMNALSIAQRELQMGNAPDEAERESLIGLNDGLVDGFVIGTLSQSSDNLSGDSSTRSSLEPPRDSALNIAQANRDLAARIRAGLADPGTGAHAAVFAHLRLVGESRLQASNPKVLRTSKP